MNNIEIIENGNMTFDQAVNRFAKLTREEVKALLEDDLEATPECNIIVKSGQFKSYSEGVFTKHIWIDDDTINIKTGNTQILIELNDFHVEPDENYDTSDIDYPYDIRNYVINIHDQDGAKTGKVIIEI